MTQLLPQPRFQPISPSGDTYPGAKAYFYLTGTTTLTNVYASSALTTTLSNPVVADAGGLFAAIYLSPAITYRIYLTESDGTLIYDVDPVAGGGSSSSAIDANTLNGQAGSYYLTATNLNAGTLPDARFPATLPAASGVNLTALNASNLASGTVPDARLPATLPASSGANLTALNASNLSSGTVPDARFPATLPAVSGVNLTALNATQLTSGTIPAARVTSIDAAATVNSQTVGYRGIPISATTSGSIAATEAGKMVMATAGVTIPNSTFAAGDAVSITNNSGSGFTITASVGTLYWTATGGTGNRTLAARGQCTVTFLSATVAYISGAGLS